MIILAGLTMLAVRVSTVERVESVKACLEHDKVPAKVALVAVAQKVIIFDYGKMAPEQLFGVAAMVLALDSGYYLPRLNRSKQGQRGTSSDNR